MGIGRLSIAACLLASASCVTVDAGPESPEAPDPRALLRDLDARDPIAREKAFDGLVAAGEAARPAVDKALGAASDPELRARLDQILREIRWASVPLVSKPEDLAGRPEGEAQAIGVLETLASIPEEKPLYPFVVRTPEGRVPLVPGDLALPAAPERPARVRGTIRSVSRAAGRPGGMEVAWVLWATEAESLTDVEAKGATRRIKGHRLAADPTLRDERDRILEGLRRFDVLSYDGEAAGRFRALLRRLIEIDDGASAPSLAAIASNPKSIDAYAYDAVGALAALGTLESRALLREAARTAGKEGLRKRVERALATGR